MNPKRSKASWWVLYVLVFVMIGMLLLESVDGLPSWANDVAGIGIVITVFGTMILWVRANASTLMEDERASAGVEEYRITVIPPQASAESSGEDDANDPKDTGANLTDLFTNSLGKERYYVLRTSRRAGVAAVFNVDLGRHLSTDSDSYRTNRVSEPIEW
jgi:hypothetical protein